ncbi:MAG TPA: hypothetical protein VET88_12235, partial [Gammaproteobacteria bacterium]|nr:hypothetical protein [Gammaproteobacteria bacterium]
MSRLKRFSALHTVTVTLAVLLALVFAPASASTAAATPANLEAWSDWVVRDVEDFGCPQRYDNVARRCAYPGHLVLNLDSNSGSFTQTWRAFREARVFLPGSRDNWPQDVNVDGTAVAVVDSRGHPAITLAAGQHTVTGNFRWQQLPESLAVPPDSGLVTLQ